MSAGRHLRVVGATERAADTATWSGDHFGWTSRRYPHLNGIPHNLKLLRFPPNGNPDEWVDHGDAPNNGDDA